MNTLLRGRLSQPRLIEFRIFINKKVGQKFLWKDSHEARENKKMWFVSAHLRCITLKGWKHYIYCWKFEVVYCGQKMTERGTKGKHKNFLHPISSAEIKIVGTQHGEKHVKLAEKFFDMIWLSKLFILLKKSLFRTFYCIYDFIKLQSGNLRKQE